MLNLKMIFRSWWRSSMSTLISMTSLTIGLVCSTLLILFVMGEYKIANSLGDTERVYLLEGKNVFFQSQDVRTSNTPAKIGFEIANRFGDIEQHVVFESLRLRYDTKKRPKKGLYRVTPNLCELFEIPVKEGDLSKTLCSANEIAVTESFMQEVYGKSAVLGDIVTGESGYDRWVNDEPLPIVTHTMTITTILDETNKNPINYGALSMISMADMQEIANGTAFFTNYHTFIKLNSQSSPEKLQEKFATDTTELFSDITMVPFKEVYFDGSNRGGDGRSGFINRRDVAILNIGLIVAFAVLIIAAFNYINITMTRARGRLKNIAGQRIFGATKWAVRWQSVLDTTMLVLISFGISLLFINAIIPQFNGFMESNISLADLFYPRNTMAITGLLATLIILPSLYILLKIEVSSPMETFKNPLGRNVQISSVMVIAQFVISVVLITVSINISRQMEFIASQRPMADAIIEISNSDKMSSDFVDRIKSMPWVIAYTNSTSGINGSMANDGISANMIMCDNQAQEFYRMELVDGRMFDQGEQEGSAIVNETLVRILNIEQPAAGKEFNICGNVYKIVGVVKDFVYQDAHKNIQPLIIENSTQNNPYEFSIKVSGNVAERIDEIKAMWKDMQPTQIALIIKTLEQVYKDMHPQEQRLMTMVNIFMVISMMLTALGLFGLAFYTVGRRTREIAIRKIHGSTTGKVILLLCRTFAIWVGIAFAVALPIAYYLSNEWLSTFIFRVPIVAWVFLATAGVAALITFITVIFQTWNAARANPARSIKAE